MSVCEFSDDLLRLIEVDMRMWVKQCVHEQLHDEKVNLHGHPGGHMVLDYDPVGTHSVVSYTLKVLPASPNGGRHASALKHHHYLNDYEYLLGFKCAFELNDCIIISCWFGEIVL
ncbi:hypothetical protein OIU85_026405 [Salix viminalis]|uniref:Uncharacterized protein n=1 Tax=Salix viminalis TaxID=40686 RepID=A0A9Q0YYK0_SALVM|nr:hypothetical protein OIU85_026405 [Salix viminalis]